MWFSLVVVAVIYALWKLFYKEDDPIDSLPGPTKLPIIGNMLDMFNMTPGEKFKYERQLSKTYKQRYMQKIFYRRIVYVHHPDDVEVVLSHSKNITKNVNYDFLKPWLGTGLLLSTGSKWFKRRKILTSAFHFDILKDFASLFEEKSRRLVDQLRANNGEPISLLPVMSNYTLFTLCETALGTKLDTDRSVAAAEYKDAISKTAQISIYRLPRIWLYIDAIFNRTSAGREFAKNVDIIHSFADNVIVQRKEQRLNSLDKGLVERDEFNRKKRTALLDLLLEAEAKREIDLEGIREEVNTFMFAGHDTTGTALTFSLMLLSDHEEAQERILEEYNEVMRGKETPTLSEFAEMKYLDAVIKETLRLYPNPHRVGRVLTEDITLGGVPIKAGTEIGVQIIDLHHREDFFPEPEKFRPERFLRGEIQHPYSFVPFSAGPRNCLGQKFAMLEIKSVLTHICNNFKLVPMKRNWRVETVSDIVLKPAEPIYIKFVPR
ncbi:cytochrome P450 4C1 isoform X1 [Bombyx mori]|uniref:Cytochrome P450 n=1 Tax=Bombyx mori TaxID=7091 RepID=A0A8R2AR82_BOMMO|nr:cytochrome P450 4C1 [Bombyx mori]